jgi:hypothetical protein
MACFTLDPKKSPLQTATVHESLELLDDVGWQLFALVCKVLLEVWPMFLNDLV